MLGDNLGLNQVLGFVDSFHSDYSCRVCKVTAAEPCNLVSEMKDRIRTADDYEKDISKKDMPQTGLKESCIFNKVGGFNVVENISLDCMHDVLEGVGSYVLLSLIKTFVFEKRYFNLQEFNARVKSFPFDKSENNIPPPISLNRLQNYSLLKMSAAEISCLVRYFGLIIGDKIPKFDEHWEIYILLRKIFDILTSPVICKADAIHLENYVTEHHR